MATPVQPVSEPDRDVPQEAAEFVRFCRNRRRVGWPELYDEMCAVAGRHLYRDWGLVELAEHGIRFTLGEMPRLAEIVGDIEREERDALREVRHSDRSTDGNRGPGAVFRPATAMGQ
jgi:hypothetical protein